MATLHRVIREALEKVSATAVTARWAFYESSNAIKMFLLIKGLLFCGVHNRTPSPIIAGIKKRQCV